MRCACKGGFGGFRVAVLRDRNHVVGCVGPHGGSTRRNGCCEIADDRQVVVVDHHRKRCFTRLRQRVGDDGGHRLSDMAHHFMRQCTPRRRAEGGAIRPLVGHGDAYRLDASGVQLGTREHRHHAGHRAGCSGVDGHDACMRTVAAHEGNVGLVRQHMVVGEAAFTAHQRWVFDTAHSLPAAETKWLLRRVHAGTFFCIVIDACFTAATMLT